MTFDLTPITRRFQPAAVLAATGRLFRQMAAPSPRKPRRRERRSMNG